MPCDWGTTPCGWADHPVAGVSSHGWGTLLCGWGKPHPVTGADYLMSGVPHSVIFTAEQLVVGVTIHERGGVASPATGSDVPGRTATPINVCICISVYTL